MIRASSIGNGVRILRAQFVLLVLLATMVAVPFASPAAAAGPTLAILSPANNAVIGNGTPVVVTFNVSSFVFVQPGRVGQVVSPNEGHLDVFVDGQYVRLIIQVEPILLSLDSGAHTILLQLKGNDGLPLTPDVSASITVMVTHGPAAGLPAVTIAFPQTGTGSGHDVYVAAVVRNFTLVDPRGRQNAPNEGHLMILLNGNYQEELSRYEPAFVVDMPDGDNTITVRLVNNDGTSLTPDVSASTTVHVKAATATLPEILNLGITVVLIYILIVLILRRRKASARLKAQQNEKP